MSHFKHPRVLTVNRIATRTSREKKNNSKAESLVYIFVDNRERARTWDTKQRRRISLQQQHENYRAAGRRWEMLATSEVKMSGNGKKKQKAAQETKYFVSTCDIVFIKGCNSEEVSCCSHAKQRQRNWKNCSGSAKSFCRSRCRSPCRRRLALHHLIFCSAMNEDVRALEDALKNLNTRPKEHIKKDSIRYFVDKFWKFWA